LAFATLFFSFLLVPNDTSLLAQNKKPQVEPTDLIRNIHGVAPIAELDGDEIGYLVAKVAEIKRQR